MLLWIHTSLKQNLWSYLLLPIVWEALLCLGWLGIAGSLAASCTAICLVSIVQAMATTTLPCTYHTIILSQAVIILTSLTKILPYIAVILNRSIFEIWTSCLQLLPNQNFAFNASKWACVSRHYSVVCLFFFFFDPINVHLRVQHPM